MENKDSLTNEKILKKFKSQFELVNYAILLAENMIKSGRDSRVKTDGQNKAMQIVAEIATGKDQFDDIPEVIAVVETHTDSRSLNHTKHSTRDRDNDSFGKSSEKKRGRKILAE